MLTAFICAGCGVPLPSTRKRRHKAKTGQARFFCSGKCQLSHEETHPRFKGGRVANTGYRMRRVGQLEHRVIVEKLLGRALPSRVEVHHVNEIRSDNSRGNLVVCENRAYHMLLHARARVLRAGGRPGRDKICGRCRRVLPLADFGEVNKRGRRVPACYCRQCNAAKVREAYAASA